MPKLGITSVVCAAMLQLANSAAAGVVNVDFNVTGGASGTYSGTAVAPDPGTFWNGVTLGSQGAVVGSVTSGPLSFSTGGPSGITVTLNNFGAFDANPSNTTAFHGALMNDIAYDAYSVISNFPAGASAGTFTINNLIPGGAYSLYVYSQNGGYNNVKDTYTIGASSQTITNSNANAAAFVAGGNYALFTGLVASGTGTISGTFVTDQPGNYAGFNGFQLVTPEPASCVLFALGIIGLFFLRGRGKQAPMA